MGLSFVNAPSVSPDNAALGLSESELARAMTRHLARAAPSSGAEALRLLRQAFPDSPLTARVAALGALTRK
jgi:hypothetical protein